MYNPLTALRHFVLKFNTWEEIYNKKVNDYEINTIKNELLKINHQILSIENTLSCLQNDVEYLNKKK